MHPLLQVFDGETNMKKLIMGISGASGVVYGVRALQLLRSSPVTADVEVHLVMTDAAKQTLAYETSWKEKDVEGLANKVHHNDDIAAPLASGSFLTAGMIIAPASMRSCADIANGSTGTLLTRAADVVLKERRRLVLMARETPLHLGHLRTLTKLAEMGAVIAPPVPAFYARPRNLRDMVDHSIARALALLDIDVPGIKPWDENAKRRPNADEDPWEGTWDHEQQ